jgi:hypothetical protein
MDRMDSASASTSLSPSPERQPPPHRSHHLHHRRHLPRHRGRRAVGILSDGLVNGPQTLQVAGLDGGDAHIIINEAGGAGEVGVGVGPVRVGGVGGVEEGLTPRGFGVGRRRCRTVAGIAATGNPGDAPDATPRAAVIGLPMMPGNNGTIRGGQQQHQRHATIRARPIALESPTTGTSPVIPIAPTTTTTAIPSPTATTTHTIFPTRTSNASTSHTPAHHTSGFHRATCRRRNHRRCR